jgi:hypothetical protein
MALIPSLYRTRAGQSLLCLSIGLALIPTIGRADPAATARQDKVFSAVITDDTGVETEIRNLHFYWEEKVSETSFVPHELKHVPVKRGNATLTIKFDAVKSIDVRPAENGQSFPLLSIALSNGKTGDFALAIAGSFTGSSEFGDIEIPVRGVRKLVLK